MANSEADDENTSCVPFLVKIYGENVNEKYHLKGPMMQIGRHPLSQIRIDSPTVSRNHCSLIYANDHWIIRDNGSQNGTFVNGQRVMKNKLVSLEFGDILFLGPPSENPHAFSYANYPEDRVCTIPDTGSKNTSVENNEHVKTESKLLAQYTNEYTEFTNTQKKFNKKNLFPSNNNINTIMVPDFNLEQKNATNIKSLQNINEQKFKLEDVECELSTKPHTDGNENDQIVQMNNDSQSLLKNDMCNQELLSCQKVEFAVNKNRVSEIGVLSQAKRTPNDREHLIKKLALLSEKVKHLEQSKLQLLKEYESVCNKDRMLDDALAEQKRLKEEMQMCEVKVKNKFKTEIMERLEEELICNICTEVLIKPTVLDCSHTFCEHCITEWKKKKGLCPICRNKIKSMTQVLVLDHFIDKTLETLTPNQRERRLELILQREQSKYTPKSKRQRRKKSWHRRPRPLRITNLSEDIEVLTEIRNTNVRSIGPVRVPLSNENIELIMENGNEAVPLPSESVEIIIENEDNISSPITAAIENTLTGPEVSNDDYISAQEAIDLYLEPCYHCGMYDHGLYGCSAFA